MSFPGRPPMVPGMPVGPPPGIQMSYMGLGAPPPLMSAIVPPHPQILNHPMYQQMIGPPPMGPGMAPAPPTVRAGYRPPVTMGQNAMGRSPVFSKRVAETGAGPAVTVFVGNITERAPDAMIRHILAACGQVVSWKRVQGASGRAPAFGFCEYGSPDAGLRAVRLLHDLDLGGKKLVVKVDAKTKVVLDEFKDDRRRKLGTYGQKGGGGSPLQDEKPDEEDNMDYMDDDMKGADQSAVDRISAVIQDYEPDMKNYNPPNSDKERKVKSQAQEKLLKLGSGLDGNAGGDLTPNFDDGEMEEGKRDLITREIGKFREIMKKQEEEKEAERRRKEAKEKERREKDGVPRSPPEHRRRRERSPASPMSPRRSRSRSRSPPPLPRSRHSVSPPPLPSSRSSRPQPPSRSPSPESTYSNKLRAKGRDWRRSHSRSRERDEPMAKRSEREIQKERELEEEAKERKKQDRKAREKEAAYQERLRNWEGRERRKAKEHAKEREKERRTQEQQAREACRIKEFLEDYDDDRDDNKFYKGRELAKKLAAREAELEGDMRDRQREREELEEIRAKIYSDKACENPSAEFERIREEREQQYKPKFLVRIEAKIAPPPPSISESGSRPASPPPQSASNGGSNLSAPPAPSPCWRPPPTEDSGSALASPPIQTQHQAQPALAEDDSQLSAVSQASMPPMDDSVSPAASRGFSGWRSPHPPEPPAPASPPPQAAAASTAAGGVSIPVRDKKRKLEIREVFNTEDDDEGSLGPSGRKRKPLVPLDYGEEKGAKKKDGAPGDSKASQEEKRKHIKSLIDKIPTDKEALFGFPIDWEAVDQTLMERRIRPWINKKIIEYIGEPEPTLVDFICSKVLVGSPPQGILDDVQMVLDDEAEVFVVKMWRLLIYEIEAKKLGLVK